MHISDSNAFQGIYYSRINARKQPNYKWLYNERSAYLPCPSSNTFPLGWCDADSNVVPIAPFSSFGSQKCRRVT